MNRFTQFLISPIFLNILGVIAFSALIWFGFDYVSFGEENTKLPHSIRAIIILGFILLLMFVWIIKLWRRQSNNSQMIEEIQHVEPDLEEERTSEEISALNQRFSDALSVLKRANLKSGGKSRTLYELPWYIIIGPPGSGKTTALVNSDLDFPLAQSHGKGSLGGVGGTRNCDWWFTNESVLIDTAGRYTTQDSHRVIDNTAWQNFLGLLKKYRPMRPINGALVAVSLQDLITQTPEQRENQAKLIRERINELQQELNIRFPVYVILTKCDLVPGFNEFFANLTQSERQQVWGMTFNSEDNDEIVHGLPSQFQQLVNSLNERVMWRVHNERDVDKRALIQGFSEQVNHLQPVVLGYLKQLMTPNLYTKQPLFRGVYLSSGTQEGMPIDRMMASVSRDFGFNNDKSRMYSGNGKSYFIHRLFKDIIFPEAEVVGSNQKLEKRTGLLRKAYFAALGVVFLATLSTWSLTVAKNNEYIDQVNEQVSLYHKATQNLDPVSFSPADTLKALSHLHKGANIYNQDSHPWLTGLGLYDGSVDQAADDLYKNALKTLLLPRLNHELLSALEENTRGKTTADINADGNETEDEEAGSVSRISSIEGDDQLIDSLRAYLMLTDETHRDTEVIQSWFDDHWRYSMSGRATEQASLKQHLATLMENAFTSPKAKSEAIAKARQRLQKIPIAQRLYIQLVSESANTPALDLYSELGGINASLLGYRDPTSDFYMPYIFTKDGFKDIKFDEDMPLLNNLEKDRWIYGNEIAQADFTEEDKAALAKELKTLYLADYITKWQRFSGIFSTPKFANLNDAGRKLQQFSDPLYSPIIAYLKLIKDNTALTPDWSGAKIPKRLKRSKTGRALNAASKLANKLNEPTRVDIHFHPLNKLIKTNDKQPSPAAAILGAIKSLDSQMSELAIAPDPSQAAFGIAKGRFSGSGAGPISRLYLLSKRSPAPLKGWLKSLADESWRIVISHAQGHLNKSWRQQVYDVFRKNLANHYPLKKQRSTTASVDVFNEFFGPGGIEEAFVESEIKPFLNTRTWRLKRVNNKVLPISSKAIAMFKQASYIRKAFYGQGASSASAKFNLKPLALDSTVGRFELRMGEDRYSYTHGPKITKKTKWIAGETVPISIFFEDLNKTIHEQQFEGDWAWIRLLDAANIQRKNNKKYSVTFSKGSRQATYQMTTKSRFNIFNLNVLRNYKISARL